MSRSLPAALLAALALAGCGVQGDDAGVDRFEGEEKRVAQVVEDLGTAGGDKDAAELCSRLLSRALVDRIAAGPLDCEQEIGKALDDADGSELRVQRVTVSGANAVAEVRDGEGEGEVRALSFVRQGRDWRLSAFC